MNVHYEKEHDMDSDREEDVKWELVDIALMSQDERTQSLEEKNNRLRNEETYGTEKVEKAKSLQIRCTSACLRRFLRNWSV